MTRDEEFLAAATAYAEAWAELDRAKTEARKAADRERQQQERVNDLARKLGSFVGANVTTRNAAVRGVLVRVEHVPNNRHTVVIDTIHMGER